jgi:hypothetical protein
MASTFINYDMKWPELNGLSLFEWTELNVLNNKDLVFESTSGFKMPSYFTDPFEAAPEPE